ncbi:TetR family transcriptional regulator [Actinocrispum sp. NPDC049592]|uniref:TetR/AcrR family transcriptional regulator n=1 Tax=Actinocrispum sp. NPDC049592 TaxID=3154835 RepID=UPI003445C57E
MARRSQRRDALLAAAVEVVGERGVAGTTHRAVTERAEVPLATASYYFSSIDELIAEALTAFVRQRAEEMALPGDRVDEAPPAEVAEWYANQVMGLEKGKRLAFYEVLLNAARTPELQDAARNALRSYQDWAVAGLNAAGAPRGTSGARAFVALGLGFGLLHLVEERDSDTDELFAALRDLFIGSILDPDEHTAWTQRLATHPSASDQD